MKRFLVKRIGHMTVCVCVNYDSWPFQISRSTDSFDLKIGLVLDLDKICSQTNFKVNLIIFCA